MAEREKVIRGFECCLRNDHKKCPYYSADVMETTCYTRLHTDALTLLKKQQPVEMDLCNGEPFCPTCGSVVRSYYNFCVECGQKFKKDSEGYPIFR